VLDFFGGTKDEDRQSGLLNRIIQHTTTTATYYYYRVTGTIQDSRTSKGYPSTIYKCAQDHMAYYSEKGNDQSIFYDEAGMQINLLFKHETEAFAFQNTLMNFRFVHPTFGNKINIDETVVEVHLFKPSKRVFHHHYAGADNNESPVLNLYSNDGSECYNPLQATDDTEPSLMDHRSDFAVIRDLDM
jgi:hypothetical protein